MGRGVYIEVTHREGCGLKNATASARRVPVAGNGRRMCKCSPRVRAQVKRRWVAEGVFPEGWTQANLRQFEAEAVGAREAHESGRRTIERDRVPTFGELAADYLARLERRRELDEVAAQTVRQRRTGVRRLEARGWTGKPVTAITREAVDELRAELRGEGYAMNTISGTYVATIAVILNESDAIGRWLPTSPTSQRWARRSPRTLVRPERTPRSLDIDFVFALLDEAAKRDDGLLLHDMILTGVTTGMRKREIAGLRPECIHLRERRIEVVGQLLDGGVFEPPKSYVERTTVMCDALAERLRVRLAQAGEYVFAVPGEELPWSRMEQGSRFNKVWEACGPRRKSDSWHALRHTFATTLDAGRCRPLAIDAVMGHKNQGVSFRYRHVLAPDLDEMVRVLNEQFNRTPPDVVRLDDRRRKAA
jgi:integrase